MALHPGCRTAAEKPLLYRSLRPQRYTQLRVEVLWTASQNASQNCCVKQGPAVRQLTLGEDYSLTSLDLEIAGPVDDWPDGGQAIHSPLHHPCDLAHLEAFPGQPRNRQGRHRLIDLVLLAPNLLLLWAEQDLVYLGQNAAHILIHWSTYQLHTHIQKVVQLRVAACLNWLF